MAVGSASTNPLAKTYLSFQDQGRLFGSRTAVSTHDDDAMIKAARSQSSSLELSDDAKKIIARYRSEKAAADRLERQASSSKTTTSQQTGASKGSIAKALFAVISGQAVTLPANEQTGKMDLAESLISLIQADGDISRASVTVTPVAGAPIPTFETDIDGIKKTASMIDLNDPVAAFADPESYHDALRAKNIHPDGRIDNWNVGFRDVVIAPKTADEVNYWYKTEGQIYLDNASNFPSKEANELAEAITNRTVTLRDARDIPGLNFRNWVSYSGGEGGSGNDGGMTANLDVLKSDDPHVHSLVTSKGVVVTWTSKPDSSQ